MTARHYHEKHRTIKAIQFNNYGDLPALMKFGEGRVRFGHFAGSDEQRVLVDNLAEAHRGYWIIKHDDGRLSVCDPDTFAAIYEAEDA